MVAGLWVADGGWTMGGRWWLVCGLRMVAGLWVASRLSTVPALV